MKVPDIIANGGLNWRKLGYSYTLSVAEARQIREGGADLQDDWLRIIAIVEAAKAGDFSASIDLQSFVKPSRTLNTAPTALFLIGDFGRNEDLIFLADMMKSGEGQIAVYACEAARNAGAAWLIPHMLSAWENSTSLAAHEIIGFAIADLLETAQSLDEIGEIADKASVFTQDRAEMLSTIGAPHGLPKSVNSNATEDFRNTVLNVYSGFCDKYGNDKAIWGGKPFNVVTFAEEFLALITDRNFTVYNSPLVEKYRAKFEATTGTDCSEFFRNNMLQQIVAVGALERFLDSNERQRFKVGVRYFYGREIT